MCQPITQYKKNKLNQMFRSVAKNIAEKPGSVIVKRMEDRITLGFTLWLSHFLSEKLWESLLTFNCFINKIKFLNAKYDHACL